MSAQVGGIIHANIYRQDDRPLCNGLLHIRSSAAKEAGTDIC